MHRQEACALVEEANLAGARKFKACELLGITLRTLERWKKAGGLVDKRAQAQRSVSHSLSAEERQRVLAIAGSAEYADLPPCKIVPTLASKGIYVASESSFYRILRFAKQLTHRLQTKAPRHSRPQVYAASGPNQLWSWDITYMPSQVKGLFFYLYLAIDIYSRKIVGWRVHEQQSAELAALFIEEACIVEGISLEQLVLHADNGGPMKGMTMLAMLEKLGVTPSFSRPSVSDDNAYSESLFRTLKYHQSFPVAKKFADVSEASCWCERFVHWYNCEHLHSGIKFVTPQQRHNGEDVAILAKRDEVYAEAKLQNPRRWSGATRNWQPIGAVMLNPQAAA